MLERLPSIKSRLQELARLDPQFQLFGAASHRYQLAPPLSEEEVAAFETLHGVRLPDDYRAFLLEVGSSGAGPHHGLKALGGDEHLEDNTLPIGLLAMPFPLREWRVLVNEPGNLSDAEIFANHWVAGTLCLSHVGCAMFDLLVVSGDERGHIWTDSRCNDFGVFPVAQNCETHDSPQENAPLFSVAESQTTRISFLDWYDWWLDWSLEEVKAR